MFPFGLVGLMDLSFFSFFYLPLLLICDDLVRPNYLGDPEADMTVPEIIRRWGYPVEIHSVITTDGYILVMHRIPRGKNDNSSENGAKPVVFLQHGLLCTSSVWVMNQPNQSAAFIFADYGFDVWMGNNRGNTYSRYHTTYATRSHRFWQFTWTEMAEYDTVAMIDEVLTQTGQSFLYYVGHSQGTLIMFTKLSYDQKLNEKVKIFFALAPIGTIANVKGLFSLLGSTMFHQLQLSLLLFGDTEFLPNNIISRSFTEFVCGISSNNPFCENFIFLLSGPDSHQLNKSRIGVYLSHNPAGTSTRNMLHIAQMVRHGKHSPFDFVFPQINQKYYNQPTPPLYDISRIKTDMYLYYSDADWIANEIDIKRYLLVNLPSNFLKSAIKLNDFNHNDFLWGSRAPDEIYIPIAKNIWSNYYEMDSSLVESYDRQLSALLNTEYN